MASMTVGLIPSPDLPANVAEKVISRLAEDLEKRVDATVDWHVEREVNPITGAAEYVSDIIEKAARIKQEHAWDYVICLTDLPSFSDYKAVTTDASVQRGAALVSLPSFGAFPLKHRIRKAFVFIVELLYTNGYTDQTEKKTSPIRERFLLARVNRVIPQESGSTDVRFILQSSVFGWLRVLSGMTFANRPWLALKSFKKILALAFATGTYISIFSTPWQLSVSYTPLRFILLMLLSIGGMVTWIIFAHNLWERPSSKGQNQYRMLYNTTTVMTLICIAVLNYVLLYAMFMFSISLFVPAGLFEEWTDSGTDQPLQNFMRLAWLATSLGTLAGAIGATVEKEDEIRHIAYSYRQLTRYYQMEQGTVESDNRGIAKDESSSYEGTEQRHREEEGAP
ncbi:hypothetical protein GCM10028778_16940 [Barrientosiimonas marina]|uniref:5,10-methylene-tetrahydrofolate dehydrogenase n=1 Tax=Lentibacillus kimchii TaxID=1542911 RepID=A0ABW2UVQ6_9BACI